jgi:hypothetical protein
MRLKNGVSNGFAHMSATLGGAAFGVTLGLSVYVLKTGLGFRLSTSFVQAAVISRYGQSLTAKEIVKRARLAQAAAVSPLLVGMVWGIVLCFSQDALLWGLGAVWLLPAILLLFFGVFAWRKRRWRLGGSGQPKAGSSLGQFRELSMVRLALGGAGVLFCTFQFCIAVTPPYSYTRASWVFLSLNLYPMLLIAYLNAPFASVQLPSCTAMQKCYVRQQAKGAPSVSAAQNNESADDSSSDDSDDTNDEDDSQTNKADWFGLGLNACLLETKSQRKPENKLQDEQLASVLLQQQGLLALEEPGKWTTRRRRLSVWLYCTSLVLLLLYAILTEHLADARHQRGLGWSTASLVLLIDGFTMLAYQSGIATTPLACCVLISSSRVLLLIFGPVHWFLGDCAVYLLFASLLVHSILHRGTASAAGNDGEGSTRASGDYHAVSFHDDSDSTSENKQQSWVARGELSRMEGMLPREMMQEAVLLLCTGAFFVLLTRLPVLEQGGGADENEDENETETDLRAYGIACVLLVLLQLAAVSAIRLHRRMESGGNGWVLCLLCAMLLITEGLALTLGALVGMLMESPLPMLVFGWAPPALFLLLYWGEPFLQQYH